MADNKSNGLAKADDLTNNLANNLTNNEIIEFLKCCAYSEGCENCPYSKKCDGTEHIIQAIDLINRQKAEIERLKSMNQSKLDIIHDVRTDLETAKSEAIREFAERLKNKSELLAPSVYAELFRAVSVEEIDNLVKEMTEGNNAE